MKHLASIIIVLCSLFTVAWTTQASDSVSQSITVLNSPHQSLQATAQYYIDSSGQATPQDIISRISQFSSVHDTTPYFGRVKGGLWLLYTINNQTFFTNWTMSVRYEHLQSVSAYGFKPGDTSSIFPLYTPEQKDRFVNFPMTINSGETSQVLVHIQHDISPIIAPVFITQDTLYTKQLLRSQFIWVFFFSALLTIAFFNFTSFVMTRDSAMLAFIIHITVIAISQVIMMGHLSFLLTDIDWTIFTQYRHISFLTMSLSVCIYLLFFVTRKCPQRTQLLVKNIYLDTCNNFIEQRFIYQWPSIAQFFGGVNHMSDHSPHHGGMCICRG